ncbi:MAG: hypothetical protein Kow00122_12370 [Thermoleophilia bacterium]
MERPRLSTILSAALASSAAFYVITRSGLAGTLAGAAVASLVYNGASHWVGGACERGMEWWRRRRSLTAGATGGGTEGARRGVEPGGPAVEETAIPASTAAPAGRAQAPVLSGWRRRAVRWAPLVLAAAALGASIYSVAAGTPLERVIVRERVIEKPVVERQVVIQKETVTVTVPAPTQPTDAAGNTVVAPPSTAAPSAPAATTTTTAASTTTTTTRPAPSSTTPTVAAPPATPPTTVAPAPGG